MPARTRHAAVHARQTGAWAAFYRHWIAPGVATMGKHGPRLNVFSAPPPRADVTSGTVHIRAEGVLTAGTKRLPPASGLALTAHNVGSDLSETLRLRACAAVPSHSTHAASAPPHAPRKHTLQAARQAAVGATLRYAWQLLHGGAARVVVTLYSVTTIRDIEQASQPPAANGPPAPDESSAEQPTAKRRRKQTLQ